MSTPGDVPQLDVVESMVLHKFDGDLTSHEMESAKPVETVILDGDGNVLQHIIHDKEV